MSTSLPMLENSRPLMDGVLMDGAYGWNLTSLQCELIAIQNIEHRHMDGKEVALFQSKWFDYRRLHPTKSTYLYAKEYLRAYQLFLEIRLDRDRAQYMKPSKGYSEDIFDASQKDYVAYWKGRQAADKLGIPYGFYCRSIMRFAEQSLWKRAPRPSQMYSEKMMAAAQEAWDEELKVNLKLPRDPVYLAVNYKGLPEQKYFQRYLVQHVKTRQRKEFILYQLICVDAVLIEAVAIQSFGEEVVERAKALNLF